MNSTIRKTMRVGAGGVLVVPLGEEEAGTEVDIIIAPSHSRPPVADMTPEQYREFVDSFAGSWVGDFPEATELPFEKRDEF